MLQRILKISHATVKIQHSQNKYKKQTTKQILILISSLDIYNLYITDLQCPYMQNNDVVTTQLKHPLQTVPLW